MEPTFHTLAEQYRPMLLAYFRAVTGGDPHASEDLVQETLLAAHRSLADWREKHNFGGWLRGIARNKALESQRADSRRRWFADSRVLAGMEDVFALLDGPEVSERADRLAQIRRCAERLAGALRDAIQAVYVRGESLRQAADALGATPAAMAQRVSRARDAIRRCVQAQREETELELRRSR